tara:strand:- start:1189 stop:1614 length:426 start_codon:yes stop_codon:yes gene_type:complete
LSSKKLKLRIKKNEGYSNQPYKDQLGFYTIGYGHLIKSNEKKYFKNTYDKKYFDRLFDLDFLKAEKEYKDLFSKFCTKKKERELIVEMLFQLGPKGVSKFKKLLFYLQKKQKYMVCLEMLDSLWYKQTPKRVENLIKNFVE